MKDAVSDDAAILFAQTFFGALFDGHSVGQAFATGSALTRARYNDESDFPMLNTKVGVDSHMMRLVGD